MTNNKELELTCTFVDCCNPVFLQDHYNRDNQILMAAQVYTPDLTAQEVAESLYESIQSWMGLWDKLPADYFHEQDIKDAITECFGVKGWDDADVKEIIKYVEFVDNDDPSCVEDSPEVYFYCVLEW